MINEDSGFGYVVGASGGSFIGGGSNSIRMYEHGPLGWTPTATFPGVSNFDVWTELAGLDFDEVAEGVGDGLFG